VYAVTFLHQAEHKKEFLKKRGKPLFALKLQIWHLLCLNFLYTKHYSCYWICAVK